MKNVWVICYIDASKTDSIIKDLRKKAIYQDIIAYIPTVRILQKNQKQKEIFEYVPLLFNYGFLKMPYALASDNRFLSRIKEDVKCIYAWVKDPARTMGTKPKIRTDNISVFKEPDISIATASESDIANMIIFEDENSIYSQKEIKSLKIGNIITLRGYPFDNVQAEIININESKREVKVKLLLENLIKQATVTFDNIFYTVYRAYDSEKNMREQSIEEISARSINGESKMFAEFLMKTHE